MNRFYHSKDIRTFEAHPLQFTVWRFSGKSRVIVEFVSTIMVAIVIHIFVNFVLKDSPSFTSMMKNYLSLEDQFKNSDSSSPNYSKLE